MSRPFPSLVIAHLLGLSLMTWGISAAKGADGGSVGVHQSSTPAPAAAVPNAAPPMANATNANSDTYPSFSTAPGAVRGFYIGPSTFIYYPGYENCCCYAAPAPSPAMVSSQPSPIAATRTAATPPSATASNANSGIYRSYSPDRSANATYPSPNPAVYNDSYSNYSYSNSGHSWGSRR